MAQQKFRSHTSASISQARDSRKRRRDSIAKSRVGWLLALSFLPAAVGHAQEALRSALSADSAINSQTNAAIKPQPDSLRVGPVLLNLGVYAGVTYDDNINASQYHALYDVSIHEGLNLGFLWPATVNSQVQFASEFGYVTYLKGTRSDSLEIAPNSALTWGISFEDGNVTLYDQFEYSDEVITVPSIAGINSLPRLENTIGARVQWFPKQWQLEAGISYDIFHSTDSQFAYLDRGSEYFVLRSAYRFAESTQAGLELSASQTDYRLAIQSDNTSYSIGLYLNWTVTPFLNLNVSGGPTIYQFDANGPATPAGTLTSYYFNFELTHQLTWSISHSLSARRDVSLGYNKGNQYTELFSLTYAGTWAATQNATLGLSLTYELGDQPLTFPSTTIENFSRIGFGADASYRFTENLNGGLHYSHWQRASNIQGNNYSENSVSFQLSYHF